MTTSSGLPSGPWVAVAVLERAWGRRGELTAMAMTSQGPERFETLRKVTLVGAEGPLREAEIESVWQHRDRLVFKFQGVDSIDAAEQLRGAEVCIPAAERPPAAPDEYYQSDLIGCQVIERRSGECVGVVAGWREFGGPALLEVRPEAEGEAFLVPFARAICVEIDPANRRILVELPDGLKDLARP